MSYIKQTNTKKKNLGRRICEAGNIFLMLFGAVGMVGVIGASTMTVMKGPVRTMSVVTKRTIAENNMIATGKLALIAAASQTTNDCDADNMIEPIPYTTSLAGVPGDGAGEVPSTIGAASEDPWGMKYAYCVWDHGSDGGDASDNDADCGGSTNFLEGADNETQYVLAILSAGPDGIFQTSCNNYGGADPIVKKVSGSDDLVLGYTYGEAGSLAAGLWNLKSGDPDTAEIQKKLEVSDGTTPQFAFDATAKTLTIGAGGQGTGKLPYLNTDNIQSYNGAGGTINVDSALSSDSDIITTADISGQDLAASGTLGVTGISTLGVVNAGATSVSTLGASGAVTFDTTLDVDGDVTLGDAVGDTTAITGIATVGATLDVTGDTSLSTLDTSGLADLESLTVTNDATLGDDIGDTTAITGIATVGATLDVTGDTSLSTLDTSGLAALNSLSVTNNASIGGTLNMTSGLITNVLDPVADQDAATRKFVLDNIAAGTGYTETDPTFNKPLGTNKVCISDGTGTNVNCATNFADEETDPQVGVVTTAGRYCRADGTTINCDHTAADILTGGGAVGAIDDLSDAKKDTTYNNLFMAHEGGSAGNNNENNTAIGIEALTSLDNTAVQSYHGDNNTASGYYALNSNTTGYQNTANGAYALIYNTTGQGNTASGYYALNSNTTGYYNTANGAYALIYNTTGYQNTAIGKHALGNNTTGYLNTATGIHAGRYIADGSTANETTNSSVFLGYKTKANADGDTNEIVIGFDATGAGSNTVVLGNDSITKTLLKGGVAIGSTTLSTGGTQDLEVDITGDIGATNYCDADGNNCFIATDVSGGGPIGAIDDLTDAMTDYATEHNLIMGRTSAAALAAGAQYNTFIGEGTGALSGSSTATTDRNTALGYTTLQNLTSGANNTAVGSAALFLNTDGSDNTAFGRSALLSNTSGASNTASGYNSLYSNTIGNSNTATGRSALYYNTTGVRNTAFGREAGTYLLDGTTPNATTGTSVYIGYGTRASADGVSNENVFGYTARGAGSNTVVLGNDSITKTLLKGGVAIGSTTLSTGGTQDLEVDITGDIGATNYCDADGNNCFVATDVSGGGPIGAIDDLSDAKKDTTNNNLFLTHEGGIAGDNNDRNTGIGINALDALDNTTVLSEHGDENTAVGYNTLTDNTIGFNNTALGASALKKNTEGNYNSAIGQDALRLNTTGISNTALGANALRTNTIGYGNTALGASALETNLDGVDNVAVGNRALYANTSGVDNTATGLQALSGNTTGVRNTGFGHYALAGNTVADRSVAVGDLALMYFTPPAGNAHNTAIGTQALYGVSGSSTGIQNTALGGLAGLGITTGSNNIVIGYNVDTSSPTASNEINIGNTLYGVTSDDRIGIGQVPAAGVELDVLGDIEYTGTITDVSDRRLKTDIAPLSNRGSMLDKITKVNLYSFRMKDDAENKIEFGVMAQELEEVFPILVHTADDEIKTKSVNYTGLISPIIEAVKDLKKLLDGLTTKIAELFDVVATLQEENKTLKTEVEALQGQNQDIIKRLEALESDKQAAIAN